MTNLTQLNDGTEIFGRVSCGNKNLVDVLTADTGETVDARDIVEALNEINVLADLSIAENSDREQQCQINIDYAKKIGLDIEL